MDFFHSGLVNILSHELVRQYHPFLLKFHKRKPDFVKVGMECLLASIGDNDCFRSEINCLVFHILMELDVLFRVLHHNCLF